MNEAVELHPALKESVLLTPHASGVHVGSGDRGFFLKGRNLATLVGRILAAIDGTVSIADVREGLPPALFPLFDRIVGQLWDHRLLTAGSLEDVRKCEAHRETARFLREHSREWQSCMASIRDDPVFLAGSPALVTAASLLLLDKGFGHLMVAEDDLRPEQAAAIAGCSAAQPAVQARPRARMIGSDEMSRPTADHTALLITLVDETATGHAPVPSGAAWAERDSIAGLVRNGVAVLAPCGPGSMGTAIRLAQLCRGPHTAFSEAGRSVLGALAAHEAIWARLRLHGGHHSGPPRDRFRLIRRDAGVSSFDVVAALAADRPIAPNAPNVPATPPPGGAVHPGWFDPAHGPFEWVDAPGTGFPLTVRSLRIRRGDDEDVDSGEGVVLTHWGLDSVAAERRAFGFAAALVAVEAAGLDATIAAPVFAETPSQAEEQAACLARASREEFAIHNAFAAIDLESIVEPDLAMLVRLARLYSGELPSLWVAGDAHCFVALARTGGLLSCGIAPDAEAALVEALGDAIASRQCGTAVTRQTLTPYTRLARLGPEPRTGSLAPGEAALPLQGESCFEQLHSLAWEGGKLFVGAARLERR